MFAGIRVHANENETGILDRELQDVLLWPGEWSLEELRPSPDELESVNEVLLESLIDLLLERSDALTAIELSAHDAKVRKVTINRDDFIPTVDRYPLRVALAIRRLAAGDKDLVV